MRCIQSKQFGYIFNAWADGDTLYKNESKSGLTYKAMKAGAERDPALAKRVAFFDYRCREEFYDFSKDPDALNNLIDEPDFQEQIQDFRRRLLTFLEESEDPVLPDFQRFLAEKGCERQ